MHPADTYELAAQTFDRMKDKKMAMVNPTPPTSNPKPQTLNPRILNPGP